MTIDPGLGLHVCIFPQQNLEHKLTCLRKKYNIVQSFLSVGSFFCSVLYEQDGYWMYGILHIVVLDEVLKMDLQVELTNDAYWMTCKSQDISPEMSQLYGIMLSAGYWSFIYYLSKCLALYFVYVYGHGKTK